LAFESHIAAGVKSRNYHLPALQHIRRHPLFSTLVAGTAATGLQNSTRHVQNRERVDSSKLDIERVQA